MTMTESRNLPAAINNTSIQVAPAAVAAQNPVVALVPGIALAGATAAAAFGARGVPGVGTFSPMILAIVAGIAFHNLVGTPASARPGISFSMRRLLRVAIVLLGFQLTLTQVASVGGLGLLVIATTLAATFLFTICVGRLLRVDRKLAELIAAGTSICGASAIIATNAVTEGHDEDVAYAIACVTIFGSVAMFAYPALPGILHLDAPAYGLWCGSSIHEIAQVVAASFQNGQRAGEIGTLVKLARVMMLAPVVFVLSARNRLVASRAKATAARPPLPWFVLGFIALVVVNSVISIPDGDRKIIATLTTALLTIALAAMGLETNISRLYARGVRPALLGAIAFLFIATFSLLLIKFVG